MAHGHPSPTTHAPCSAMPPHLAYCRPQSSLQRRPPTKHNTIVPPNYSPHRLCPHVLAHGSRHINHFQRSPHSTHTLLTPTTDHTALSALPARAKSPLHVQPLVVPIYLSSCSSKMFAKIHLRFATASYPAPGQQHAPKCDFPNSATLMCEPRSGPISPFIHAFHSQRSGPISPDG